MTNNHSVKKRVKQFINKRARTDSGKAHDSCPKHGAVSSSADPSRVSAVFSSPSRITPNDAPSITGREIPQGAAGNQATIDQTAQVTGDLAAIGSLWDRAYDNLKGEESALFVSYEDLLSRALMRETEDVNKVTNQIPQHDRVARRKKLQEITELGLKHMEDKSVSTTLLGHEIVLQDVVANVAGAVEWAEDYIKDAIKDLPYASIVMAGISLVLPLLKNPTAVEAANKDGFTYVTSQMRYYAAIESLLLPEDMEADLKDDLRDRVVDLYKLIIDFQVRSVIRFYRSRPKNFFRGTINYDSWDKKLQDIKERDATLFRKFETVMSGSSLQELRKLTSEAETSRKALDKLLFTAEEHLDVSRGQLGVLQEISQLLSDPQIRSRLENLPTTDPRIVKTRIEQTKGGLLQKSYCWILENTEFKEWRKSEQCRLLWIRADPGKGKTMLLCGIINELTEELKLKHTGNISFFFCQAADSRFNNPTNILRGLIYLLIKEQESLISHIRDVGENLWEGDNAWWALSNIFDRIIHDPSLQDTYVIIDALDECVTELPLLLEFIEQKSSVSPRVKWIVSSRNWPIIEKHLVPATQKVTLRLELNNKSISDAVNAYIKHKVNRLAIPNNDTRDAVRQHLSSNANDTFLWVALVCKELTPIQRWNNDDDIMTILKRFPPGLDMLYERMIGQICNSNDAELCKDILAVVSVVRRPITLDELMSFIDIPLRGPDNYKVLTEIIELCGSFLTLQEHTIDFVHKSAKDFLLEKTVDKIFPSGVKTVHHTIFLRSLQVMSRTLRQDIYSLHSPGFSINQVGERDPDPLAAVRYSCVYWVEHLCDCDLSWSSSWHALCYMWKWKIRSYVPRNPDSYTSSSILERFCLMFLRFWVSLWCLIYLINVLWHDFYSSRNATSNLRDSGSVDNFLRKHYLHWLEALSLLRSMSDGVIAMRRLENLGLGKGRQLTDLIRDARRFILSHKWIIENAPLQAYASALVFSPVRSKVRELFKAQEPGITLKPIVEDWSAVLQTLEGHKDPVSAVAFSPDGKQLASASDDRTIRLWDPATGTELRPPLEGHKGSVSAVAFSPDGKQLASASADCTIRLWDPATGTELRPPLEGHKGSVSAVAFSPDGKQLASASDDCTIRLWDPATGTELRPPLEGHKGWVSAVAFSPDGKQLASASYDCTIRLWDPATGTELRPPLEGHKGSVSAVAFSPDGKQLASASYDCTIRLWDPATGTGLRPPLEGHKGWVSAVAFSPDGKQLASASYDRTIRLWDPATGTGLRPPLEGHKGWVSAVAFSPDGKQLASASYDRTIRLWDPATGTELRPPLEGHKGSVSAVAFSPDGKQLASASYDCTIRLWDPATGTGLRPPLEGHKGSVSAVAFSPDGKQLASASDDCTIRLWDPATGTGLRPPLEGHKGSVSAVAFSPDGKQLASASADRTIRLWDPATGTELRPPLEGHKGWVWAVAFSPDGKQLASASADRTIRLWDPATGTELRPPLETNESVIELLFSTDGHAIITNLGPFSIRTLSPNELSVLSTPKWEVFVDEEWIVQGTRRILWLPSDYRASYTAIHGHHLAIGHASGRVSTLEFEMKGLSTSPPATS